MALFPPPITLRSIQKRITEYTSNLYQKSFIEFYIKFNFILWKYVWFFSFFDRPKRNISTQQTKKISQPQPIWRILILQFFAQIFIEFVSRQILLHNGTTDSFIQTIHHWLNSRYCTQLILTISQVKTPKVQATCNERQKRESYKKFAVREFGVFCLECRFFFSIKPGDLHGKSG